MVKRPRTASRIVTPLELAAAVGGNDGSESRNIQFEIIKNEIQKLAEIQPPATPPKP